MKTDLRNVWGIICLAPYWVDSQYRNKFTSLLLGDELASDDEFVSMFDVGNGFMNRKNTSYWGNCKFRISGSCFHPFRPGSMVDAIFTSSFRHVENGEQFVDKDACDALDNRACDGCTLCMPSILIDSAFGGLDRFYRDLLDRVCNDKYLYGGFKDFRERYTSLIDDVPYFETGKYKEFEDNIRKHFEKMMERHYNMLSNALEQERMIIDRKDKKMLAHAINLIKFEFVTHWKTYWAAQKYKEEEK